MPSARPSTPDVTYPLRSAARLTGLTPEILRAWENRHAVVSPLRTPGGTRRYRPSDLERLRLLKTAIDAGHRIGRIAGMSNEALERLGAGVEPAPGERVDEILAALDALDGAEAQRLLALQLSALGAVGFARTIALPLMREIGERWASEGSGIASEHLASAVLRSLLGAALQPGAAALRGARIVFATPTGERHELGLLMAALTAMGAGANPVCLGADVPAAELIRAVERSRAAVLALSVVTAPPSETARVLATLRAGLPAGVQLWIGGSGAAAASTPSGVERIESLEALERRVARLALEPRRAG
jgi:DNA-binding transcriptional MerR regulator